MISLLFLLFTVGLVISFVWPKRPLPGYRGLADATNKVLKQVARMPNPLHRSADVSDAFRYWATGEGLTSTSDLAKSRPEDASRFAAWISAKAEPELDSLVSRIDAFCRTAKFELAWLFDGDTQLDVKTAVADLAFVQGLALEQAESDAAFADYKQLQSKPNDKRSQEFARRLYRALVAADLATNPPELMLANDKARRTHVRESIEKAAAENTAAFRQVLRDLARGDAAVASAAAARTTEPRRSGRAAAAAAEPAATA